MFYKIIILFFSICQLVHGLENNPIENILNSFIGIPYKIDGTIDEYGNYTTFTNPDETFKDSGLNCSGFVLSAMRKILNKNITLTQAKYDNFKDSGKNAEMGEDWDFGYDVILNIAKDFKITLLLPHKNIDPTNISATKLYDITNTKKYKSIGFSAQDNKTQLFLRKNIKEKNAIYLLDFNANDRIKGYKVSHYHVGIIYRTSKDKIYYYHTTREGNLTRRNLNEKDGWNSFKNTFKNKNTRFLLFEIML